MSTWLTLYRTRDWEQSFLRVIPRRKLPAAAFEGEDEIDNEIDESKDGEPAESLGANLVADQSNPGGSEAELNDSS